MKRGFIVLTSTISFLFFLSLFLVYFISNEEKIIIGGEKDIHGCLGLGGYSWDEELGVCTRNWEVLEEDKETIKLVVEYIKSNKSANEITFLSIEKLNCEECFNLEFDYDEVRKIFYVENNVVKEELDLNYCSEESKLGEICTLEYNPVCGYKNKITYGNSCQACHDNETSYFISGECK